MLRRLIANTAFNVAAFGVSSVIGILVTSLIVRSWGLEEFGLIVLVRTVLPTGFGAIFDLGVSELATQVIARARTTGDWETASREITVLLSIAATVGIVVGVALWIAAPALGHLFKVGPAHLNSFVFLLRLTAAACTVLFATLVAEGIIKGFEQYRFLRTTDVSASVLYALGTLAASIAGYAYESVAVIFLVSVVLRAAVLAAYVVRALSASHVALAKPTRGIARDLLHRSSIMLQSRVVGIAQGPIFPLAIGALFGPASVGLYDLLVRLPRFARSALSLFTSAVLPVTTRLEASQSDETITRLGRAGMLFWPWITVPPLVAAAVLSPQILRLWVGPEYAGYGPWMAVMWLWPITAQYLYVSNTLVINRPAVFQKYVFVMYWQVLILFAIAASLAPWLNEGAFILAQALGAVIILPFQLRLTIREFNLPGRAIATGTLIHWATLVVGAALLLALQYGGVVGHTWQLALTVVLWCGVEWIVSFIVALSPTDRAEVERVLAAIGLHVRLPGARA